MHYSSSITNTVPYKCSGNNYWSLEGSILKIIYSPLSPNSHPLVPDPPILGHCWHCPKHEKQDPVVILEFPKEKFFSRFFFNKVWRVRWIVLTSNFHDFCYAFVIIRPKYEYIIVCYCHCVLLLPKIRYFIETNYDTIMRFEIK